MLKVIIPDSKEKLQKQIKALQYVIKRETRNKDKEIHTDALEELKQDLNKL